MSNEKVPTSHKYAVNQLVLVASRNTYRVVCLRSDSHHKLKGELGYDIVMQRYGKDYGPRRLVRESKLTAAE